MANTTIYPYGTNGQLPSSIGVINDLTTGGADKALSAEMGKELGNTVNGIAGVTGSWTNGRYGSFVAVGSTYTETKTTSYPFSNGKYKCCKIPLIAGQKLTFTAKSNGEKTLAVVDGDGKVTYVDGSNGVKYENATKDATTDLGITTTGYAYISNFYDGTASWVQQSAATSGIDGHEQRITELEDDVAVIKETTDPVLIDAQINGRDIHATFINNAFYSSGGATVGSTFNPSTSSYTGYKCAKQAVKAGDNVIVVAKGSEYQYPVIITDSDNVVVALEPKNSFVNKTITIEADGYIYVNNVDTRYTTPICHIYNASAKQMAESVMATLPAGSFIEGQSTYLPLMRGFSPYPNTNSYFMELTYVASTTCYTPWLTIPHGTYILPTMNFKVYQADAPLFHMEYAKVNENIWQTVCGTGGVIEITHNYVMFVLFGQSSSADLATLAPVYCDKMTSPAVVRKDVAHVAHAPNDNVYIYLPLRGKYYCFELFHYSSSYLEHYGIKDTYLCEIAGYPYPQTVVTRASEYECAMDIQGQGYLGGHMHGHEQMVTADTTIYLNGQSKTLANGWGGDVTGMFEMMQHSILYKTDNTTKVADIYKRWRVVDGKLHMYNRVVFAASYHINRGQFSMFGIYRHEGGSTSNPYLTCYASRNSDTRVYQTTDGWDTSSPTDGASIISTPAKATLQEQWGESGYIVRQEIFENNQKENGGMFINTNGGGEYNKMYFEIGSNFDVVEGDELFSHAVLSIE